jgi:hypothetical protein
VDRLRARLGPWWPYLILIGVPAAVFILPDLFGGHLLMTGDNEQQNYPLHVLVGTYLREGRLPLWNPYIFSGSPLLAGFNAGAFFPLVGLFVILPDRAAWIATEVILFSLIAVGMYTYLRALALSTVACFVAAATFTFSGVVLSQVNHVDMTEGYVAIPWMLLAVLHIVRDGRWRWSILLGVGFALVILGGAPEAMLDDAILVLAYAVVTAGLDRGRWWRVLSRGAAGAALALSLAAVQWLPGLSAIANSQRSGLGSGFAGTGSFPTSYGLLSVVPYLFGGYGKLGERTFFGSYNLAEVGIYLGLLPIIALVALWHPRWPSRLAGRERLTWYVVGAIGLLLALAANTPLEHLFDHLPLYGHQRLQSRNMIDVSVAICILFAGWIDRRTDEGAGFRRFDRLVALVPLTVVMGLLIAAFSDPQGMIQYLTHTGTGTPTEIATMREALYIALGFSLAATGVVWLRPVLPARWWVTAMVVFVTVDIGLVAVTSQLAFPPTNSVLAGNTAVEQYVAAHLSSGGRFYVYDPQGYFKGDRLETGLPDDNILARLPSIGGYASIVNGNYNSLTLTHSIGELNVPQLGAGKLKELDLQDIVTLPEYFMLPLVGVPKTLDGIQQVSEAHGQDPSEALGIEANYRDTSYPYYPAPRGVLAPGQTSSWFFGEQLAPSSATAVLSTPATLAVIRFGVFNAGGLTRWGPAVRVPAGATSVTSPLPKFFTFGTGTSGTGSPVPGTVGLTLQVLFGHLPAHQAVVTAHGQPYELDGALSAALKPDQWRLQGGKDGYTLFVHRQAPIAVYAIASPSTGHTPPVHVLFNGDNSERVRVSTTRPLEIVRDVAYDQGWTATISVNGRSALAVPDTAHGLVQQVRVPPGTDVVVFRYRPPHWIPAVILSGGALLMLLGLGVWALVRRRSRPGTPPAG